MCPYFQIGHRIFTYRIYCLYSCRFSVCMFNFPIWMNPDRQFICLVVCLSLTPLAWPTGTQPWVVGHQAWLAGCQSWLAGHRTWLAGIQASLASHQPWLIGPDWSALTAGSDWLDLRPWPWIHVRLLALRAWGLPWPTKIKIETILKICARDKCWAFHKMALISYHTGIEMNLIRMHI